MTLSLLETCDLCGAIRPLREIHLDGRQFLCRRCREEKCPAESRAVASREQVLNPPKPTP